MTGGGAVIHAAYFARHAISALLRSNVAMRYFARHFRRQPNGTWLCTSAAELITPKGRVQVTAGTCFAPGTTFMGIDIAQWLEAEAKKRAGAPDPSLQAALLRGERRSGERRHIKEQSGNSPAGS
jgi:hypothetical protein